MYQRRVWLMLLIRAAAGAEHLDLCSDIVFHETSLHMFTHALSQVQPTHWHARASPDPHSPFRMTITGKRPAPRPQLCLGVKVLFTNGNKQQEAINRAYTQHLAGPPCPACRQQERSLREREPQHRQQDQRHQINGFGGDLRPLSLVTLAEEVWAEHHSSEENSCPNGNGDSAALSSTRRIRKIHNGASTVSLHQEVEEGDLVSFSGGAALNAVVSRFQKVKALSQAPSSGTDYLCEYVDIVREKHGRMFVVSEHYPRTLKDALCTPVPGETASSRRVDIHTLKLLAYQVLSALACLHAHDVVHGSLSSENVAVVEGWRGGESDDRDSGDCGDLLVKLADFGLSYMTDFGRLVPFAIGSPTYIAPECLFHLDHPASGFGVDRLNATATTDPWQWLQPPTPASDVWSFGMLMLEMALGHHPWDKHGHNTAAIITEVVKLAGLYDESAAASVAAGAAATAENFPATGGEGEQGDADLLSFYPPKQTPSPPPALPLSSLLHRMRLQQQESLDALLSDPDFIDDETRGLHELIRKCLVVSPLERESVDALLDDVWVQSVFHPTTAGDGKVDRVTIEPTLHPHVWAVAPCVYSSLQRSRKTGSAREEANAADDIDSGDDVESENDKRDLRDPLWDKPLSEVFHFWKLSGGDMAHDPALRVAAPIRRMPLFVRSSRPLDEQTGRDPSLVYNERVVCISLDPLREMLRHDRGKLLAGPGSDNHGDGYFTMSPLSSLSPSSAAGTSSSNFPSPLFASSSLSHLSSLLSSDGTDRSAGNVLPPLLVRESSIDYQRKRVAVFKRLLEQYPSTRDLIIEQAKVDVPPVLRAEIWSAILGVNAADAQRVYDAIDQVETGPSDHQIELDIPRCHQYNELLSSPQGHKKMKRILHAWVSDNYPDFVYWQGLDSLLAPFLVVNFTRESVAYSCLSSLVSNHLQELYRPENSEYLNTQLLLFRQLLAYHDPELMVHLYKIGFHPHMYAIPWFLTLFTHIFPLESIHHAWDTLLINPKSLALYLAVSIMHRLRYDLLNQDFNTCISFFSNLPLGIDILDCLNDAKFLSARSPPFLDKRSGPAAATFANMLTVLDSPGSASAVTSSSSDASTTKVPWWEVPQSQEAVKHELAPRVHAGWLLDVAEHQMASVDQKRPGMNMEPVIMDIRSPEQFDKVHFFAAINLDHKDSTLRSLVQYRDRPIVVVGTRGEGAVRLASKLVATGYKYVCVLNGGISALQAVSPRSLVGSSIA